MKKALLLNVSYHDITRTDTLAYIHLTRWDAWILFWLHILHCILYQYGIAEAP